MFESQDTLNKKAAGLILKQFFTKSSPQFITAVPEKKRELTALFFEGYNSSYGSVTRRLQKALAQEDQILLQQQAQIKKGIIPPPPPHNALHLDFSMVPVVNALYVHTWSGGINELLQMEPYVNLIERFLSRVKYLVEEEKKELIQNLGSSLGYFLCIITYGLTACSLSYNNEQVELFRDHLTPLYMLLFHFKEQKGDISMLLRRLNELEPLFEANAQKIPKELIANKTYNVDAHKKWLNNLSSKIQKIIK